MLGEYTFNLNEVESNELHSSFFIYKKYSNY